jgi:predicted amino acid dehydrogenase
MKRFAFVVHPLVPLAKRLGGLRTAKPAIVLGKRDGTDLDDVGVYGRVGLGDVEGVFVGVPLLPAQILEDQERALRGMERAVQLAAPVSFVGLGGVFAVVAGRGTALEAACGLPVTTGNAATAWAASTLARRLATGPVAVLGGKGTVGKAVVEVLRGQGLEVTPDPADLRPFRLVVGCHTTGSVLAPEQLAAGTTLVDVALPRSLTGPPPPGVRVLKGESLALPAGWRRDGWGHIVHLVAGYGRSSVYACVIEPLVALAVGRDRPWQQGKRLDASTVLAFGEAAEKLGFSPEERPLLPPPPWVERLLGAEVG